MKFNSNNLFVIIVLIIAFISCEKDENSPLVYPVTFEMDTNKVEILDYTCFVIEQNMANKIPSQGSFKYKNWILSAQKDYLYEYGYLSAVTLIDDTNAEVIVVEEDGSISTHAITYKLENQRLMIDGIATPDVFYNLSDDNSRLTFTWCSSFYLKFGSTFPLTRIRTDFCAEREINERSKTVVNDLNLNNGDSLALFFTHEYYERQ